MIPSEATPPEAPMPPIDDGAKVSPIASNTAAAPSPAPSRPKWIVGWFVAVLIAIAAFFAARHYLAGPRSNVLDVRAGQPREHEAKLPPGRTFRECPLCPEMVVLPAGSFTMGSPPSERGREDYESPQHQVTIGYSFAVAKYPVTRDEYASFGSQTGANPEWQRPGFTQTGMDPVVNVSWNDAEAYVRWLSEKTGKTYRLLSEAEYEYAERAGSSSAKWWGDKDPNLCGHANAGPCNHQGTMPVTSYPPNAFGLYDMAGNIWEWTEDCWNSTYLGAPDDGNAWTGGDCGSRVVRGGSWRANPAMLRSANRESVSTGVRGSGIGFRVARTL